MKRVLLSVVLLVAFATVSRAQVAVCHLAWSQPQSPTTGNTLSPATFQVTAALVQGTNIWSHGFSDSTDYGRETMFWADIWQTWNPNLPWQVAYYVPGFDMTDPITGDRWRVYGQLQTLHNPGGSSYTVSGNIAWDMYAL